MSYLYDIISPVSVSVADVYMQFYQFIDPILAFMIFLSLGNWVFTRKYPGWDNRPAREAKMIAVAVALALTFAFALLEINTGFFFGHPIMQGFAALLLLLIIGIFLYELISSGFGAEKKLCALAFTYFVMYALFMSVYSPYYLSIHSQYPIVAAILGIGFILAIIKVIFCLFEMLSGIGGKDNGSTKTHEHPAETHVEEEHPKHEEKHEDKHEEPAHGAPATHTEEHAPATAPAHDTSALLHAILDFRTLVADYAASVDTMKKVGDTILTERLRVLHGENRLKELQEALDMWKKLGTHVSAVSQQIVKLNKALAASEDIKHLEPAHVVPLNDAYKVYTAKSVELDNYVLKFSEHYKKKEVPHP